MKNKTSLALAAGLVAMGFALSASATPINGSIGFGGTFTQVGGTSGNLTTADKFNISSVFVLDSQGDLAGAGSPIVFLSPIDVNPVSLTGQQLWSVNVSGTTYTFQVSTAYQSLTTANQLDLAGTGIMSDGPGGKDDTLGTWELGFGVSGASFTWHNTTATAPDGGLTAGILGLALVGVEGLRRRFGK